MVSGTTPRRIRSMSCCENTRSSVTDALRAGRARVFQALGTAVRSCGLISCLSLPRRPCSLRRRAEPRRCHRRPAGAVPHTGRTRDCAISVLATSPRGSGAAPSRIHQKVPSVNPGLIPDVPRRRTASAITRTLHEFMLYRCRRSTWHAANPLDVERELIERLTVKLLADTLNLYPIYCVQAQTRSRCLGGRVCDAPCRSCRREAAQGEVLFDPDNLAPEREARGLEGRGDHPPAPTSVTERPRQAAE